MELPLVSIILTSYNKANTVGNAIQSVLEQNYSNWELWIMDDASNEETIYEIEKYLDDSRIHFFNSKIKDSDRYKTTRYATLINEALPKTRGKYISYLTDDTVYISNRLRKMVAFLESNNGIDVVYSSQKVLEINGQNEVVSEKIRKTKGILSHAANLVDHCSVMHTKEIAETVKRHFGSYWSDSPDNWHNGDAVFWNRLNLFAKFFPLDDVLDVTYKTPYSFQKLNAYLPYELPKGLLVKGYLSNIFLLENNQRREIHEALLSKLHYDVDKVVTIPDPFLLKYEIGPPIDEHIFRKDHLFPNDRLVTSNHVDIYYIQDRKRRKITDMQTFEHYKFLRKDVVILEKWYLETFVEGPPITVPLLEEHSLPDNILFFDGEKYFLSQKNKLHEIHFLVMAKLNILKNKAVFISDEEKRRFKEGPPFYWNNYYHRKKGRKKKKYNI